MTLRTLTAAMVGIFALALASCNRAETYSKATWDSERHAARERGE